MPKRRSTVTYSRAPMANKDNSKEQFVFKYYRFSFSYNLILDQSFEQLNFFDTSNLILYFLLFFKKTFPIFETNFLLLKSYRILLNYSDRNFYNFDIFNKKHKILK